MQKMFTTQLAGLFKRIMDNEEFSIEDGARLLAQALAGEGTIYLYGVGEMEGVVSEALQGAEPLSGARALTTDSELTHVDRVLLISRFADDEKAIQIATKLTEENIPFVAISSVRESENTLVELADVHIDLHLKKPLLPADDGSRVGYPSLIAALYVFRSMQFVLDEMVEELEE